MLISTQIPKNHPFFDYVHFNTDCPHFPTTKINPQFLHKSFSIFPKTSKFQSQNPKKAAFNLIQTTTKKIKQRTIQHKQPKNPFFSTTLISTLTVLVSHQPK